ncbi:MAG: sulfite exporter TauE/SafE family protein [Flammeovirgaceae bacterium]
MIWVAFMLGVVGSLHCAGMCSPLLLVATARQPHFSKKLIYNVGRLLPYGFMGGAAALFGELMGFNLYQKYLSIAFGVMLLLIALGVVGTHIRFSAAFFSFFTIPLKKLFGVAINNKSLTGLFFLGLLNGFLPCGLTMLAIGYCFVLPSFSQGVLFMLVFGSGTWPMMLGFTQFIQLILNKLKERLNKVVLVVMIFSALLLIGRGVMMHNHLVGVPHASVSICK